MSCDADRLCENIKYKSNDQKVIFIGAKIIDGKVSVKIPKIYLSIKFLENPSLLSNDITIKKGKLEHSIIFSQDHITLVDNFIPKLAEAATKEKYKALVALGEAKAAEHKAILEAKKAKKNEQNEIGEKSDKDSKKEDESDDKQKEDDKKELLEQNKDSSDEDELEHDDMSPHNISSNTIGIYSDDVAQAGELSDFSTESE